MENEGGKENLIAQLEALLFIYGEPLDFKKIAKILNTEAVEVREAAEVLKKDLSQNNRGLFLILNDGKIQLTTKPVFGKFLEEVAKKEFVEDLTPASLETLAIVAYTGPISRIHIDYVRGVNSSYILRSLLLRGLINRSLDPEGSNAYLYNASFDLLKHLGIAKIEDLPEYNKYKELIKNVAI
ncbi:MAG: SMC-Scp complex subunit ScpB [Candidatus Harrisonbacteria bacterium RIFCSPHIGHO2_01_FULL_44_13]|uniref:SMC-Scp complex subunit ScpB n=1 Tax=Candidatus Harrisonbacteria bacterium RIFCSPLOWO2_01_FULL_44_18 TaxID=1798407 RepID=A0A1G1ZN48_9BACT|nr:MAG: SMC-Scp complex subunit ScpB [Candidatus Harrisonbacteria bacterium RIFCSPHIGHO2_01_FULL_44_13]OGY66004.1 MAG: SMC-Scp complex subunit ScpB [Candidatus Harrisonbacteria bacterium RIFCSPLOWO2_01_FULL_44_18]